MDVIDQSNDVEQLLRDSEINNCINNVLPKRVSDNCIDCDEPIPSELLKKQGRV